MCRKIEVKQIMMFQNENVLNCNQSWSIFVVPLKDLVQWRILQNILEKNQEFPLKEHEVLVPDD